jgi:hypothetical protein
MGRLVRVPQWVGAVDVSIPGLEGVLAPGMAPSIQGADNYLERVAKYVPAEVIAFFIFINAILEQSLKTGGKGAMMAGFPVVTFATGALIAGMALTPLFIWYVREEGDAWITNAFVSTLAFPFWAYAIGAVAFAEYRDGNLAAMLLATFTVVSGLVAPRARRPKKRRDKERDQRQERQERTERPASAKERQQLIEAAQL